MNARALFAETEKLLAKPFIIVFLTAIMSCTSAPLSGRNLEPVEVGAADTVTDTPVADADSGSRLDSGVKERWEVCDPNFGCTHRTSDPRCPKYYPDGVQGYDGDKYVGFCGKPEEGFSCVYCKPSTSPDAVGTPDVRIVQECVDDGERMAGRFVNLCGH